MLLVLNFVRRKAMIAHTCFVFCNLITVAASSPYNIEPSEAVSFLQLSKSTITKSREVSSKDSSKNNTATDLSKAGNGYTVEADWWAFQKCSAKDALPKSNRANRKPVMWVHLHKAAGTQICCEARRREKVVVPAANCNRDVDSWFKWETQQVGPFTTCDMRLAYMQEKGFTWGATERWLEYGDLCPHSFVYATLLREPMSTMLSEADYGDASYEEGQRMTWVRNAIECIEVGMWCREKDWFIFDNLMVRTFSGVGLKVPPGGVNSAHLDAAIKVLRGFNLVLLMNRLDDPRTPRAYERTIGWPFPLNRTDTSARINKGDHQVDLNAHTDTISRLRAINTFDFQLFEFAAQTYYP